MDPLTLLFMLPNLISAGGSIWTAKKNRELQERTNAQNMALVRETNAQNYSIFKETQQYNSPENQMKMLREAGINPITAYGGLAQVNRAVPIEMESPKLQAPQMELGGLWNAMSQMSNMMIQSRLQEEQINSLKLDNEFKKMSELERLYQIQESNATSRQQRQINVQNILFKKRELELQEESVASRIALETQELFKKIEETENVQLSNDFRRIENRIAEINEKYAEPKNIAELRLLNENVNKTIQEIQNLKINGEKMLTETESEELTKMLKALELSLGVATYGASKTIFRENAESREIDNLQKYFNLILNLGGGTSNLMQEAAKK